MWQDARPQLVLASGSAARAAVLCDAGLTFRIQPAELNEAAIKTAGRAAGSAAGIVAMTLAEAKATAVGSVAGLTSSFVIGADQMLECDGRWHDKPVDLTAAGLQLRALQGRTHHLHTAVAGWLNGSIVWRHLVCLAMTMRPLSDDWIDRYLQAEGSNILGCVGSYRIEGRGIQCFDQIACDHSAIKGLPLLPLLAALRHHRVLPD